MKLFKIFTALTALLVMVVLSQCSKSSSGGGGNNTGTDTTGNNQPNDTLTYVYKTGTEGYSCFRIPALIKSAKGTLLAFAEGRKNSCADNGDINMVVKRSKDNGVTWDTTITIWNDGKNTCGNPVPVIDEQSGNIILLMSWNYGPDDIGAINAGTSKDTRRAFVTSSSDDGITWSTPKEITDSVKARLGLVCYRSLPWLAGKAGKICRQNCYSVRLYRSEHKERIVAYYL